MKNSKWIWLSEEVKPNEYAEFFVPFVYSSGKTEMKISVDTEYSLYVNGEFVNAGQYADFPWYKVHDVVDITEKLKQGENEIRIVAWYMGDVNYSHYVNRPGLRFEICVDGRVASASSKETLCRRYPYLVSGDVAFGKAAVTKYINDCESIIETYDSFIRKEVENGETDVATISVRLIKFMNNIEPKFLFLPMYTVKEHIKNILKNS